MVNGMAQQASPRRRARQLSRVLDLPGGSLRGVPLPVLLSGACHLFESGASAARAGDGSTFLLSRPVDRVDYFVSEECKLGKRIMYDPAVHELPEGTTALFMVDQGGKGILGRMVAAYGPVNDTTTGTSAPRKVEAERPSHVFFQMFC